MICSKCNSILPDDVNFCPNCGSGVAKGAADLGASPIPPVAPVAPVAPASTGVAVRPVKNSHKGVVALAVISAIAIIVGVLTVVFFTNRASVLSTVMGKPKYAAMVEGNHIKKVTEQINLPAVSDGIKAASSAFQAVSTANSDLLDMVDIFPGYISSGSVAAAPMMYVGRYGDDVGVDLSKIEEMFAELLAETYGKNAVNGSVKVNVELGSALKSIIEDELYYYYDLDDIDELLDYVNGTEFTYNIAAKNDALAVTAGTSGKLAVNTKILLNGQNVYISLPFVSDKAIKLTIDKPVDGNELNFDDIKPLELDADELERIIGDIVKIYLDHYKKLDITMENGELSAAGVSVSGKLITAEFSIKELSKTLADIVKYLADDDYLAEKIVEFANNCGFEIDKDDYSDAFSDILDELEDYDEDSKDKLIIETIINNKGEVLGKSYTAVANKEKTSFAFVEAKEQSGIEIKGGDVKISLVNEKEDDQNGSCTLKAAIEGKTMSFVLKYSDVKTAEFCGNEIVTGKYELSMKLPEDFKDMLDKDAFAALNGSKLSFSIKCEADTLETNVSVKANGYINASVTETVTAVNDTSELNVPSSVIDLTPALNGDYIDDDTADELVQFVKDVVAKLNGMGLEIDPYILDELDPSMFTGKVSKDYIDELTDDIDDFVENIVSYAQTALSNGQSDKFSELLSLRNKFSDLSNRIKAKNYNMTYDEYYSFEDEFYDLYFEFYSLY